MLVVGWGPSMLMISLFDEEILMISNFLQTVYGMVGDHVCFMSTNRDLNFLFSVGVEVTVKFSIFSLMLAFLALLMFSDH